MSLVPKKPNIRTIRNAAGKILTDKATFGHVRNRSSFSLLKESGFYGPIYKEKKERSKEVVGLRSRNGSLDVFPVMTMINILENGLPISVFRTICKVLDISEKELARLIRIPVSTLARRKSIGYFKMEESERMYRILNLYIKALSVFDNNPNYAIKWLKEEAFGLGDAIPLEYAKTEIGAKEVEHLLIRIDEGIFA